MRIRRTRWFGLCCILGLLLVGCSGPGEEASSSGGTGGGGASDAASAGGGGGGELTPITVGILPIADLAPLYHAIDQGYFEEEGLDVSLEVGQGGAALVPAVLAGDYQFAFGNYVSLMLARQEGVNLKIVSNLVDGAERADRGTNAILVAPDSGIEDVSDLAGKSFAVTTLSNLAEVNIRTMLRNADVDDSDISFVELGFPDMNAAVDRGDVDAAWQAEPFVTLGEGEGLVNVGDPMYETMPSMPIAGMFASDQWLADNPDLAEAFVTGLRRGLEDSTDDEAMRTAIAANTETDEQLLEQIALANWNADLDVDKLAETGRLAAEYGILDSEPNVDDLVWQAP